MVVTLIIYFEKSLALLNSKIENYKLFDKIKFKNNLVLDISKSKLKQMINENKIIHPIKLLLFEYTFSYNTIRNKYTINICLRLS